jgi:hypothetical protein
MRFKYTKVHPLQTEAERMPRIEIRLRHDQRHVDTSGLVDSGATVNILPFSVGEQLGLVWHDMMRSCH